MLTASYNRTNRIPTVKDDPHTAHVESIVNQENLLFSLIYDSKGVYTFGNLSSAMWVYFGCSFPVTNNLPANQSLGKTLHGFTSAGYSCCGKSQ